MNLFPPPIKLYLVAYHFTTGTQDGVGSVVMEAVHGLRTMEDIAVLRQTIINSVVAENPLSDPARIQVSIQNVQLIGQRRAGRKPPTAQFHAGVTPTADDPSLWERLVGFLR